jgi:glutamate N-acetyltransferase/amino-acid N-acetyltransferase
MIKEILGGVTAPRGFRADGISCGIKKKGKDLAIISSETRAQAAALFTTNKLQAAPLKVTQEHLRDGIAQAIIVNSGNANSATGEEGLRDAREMAKLIAVKLGIEESDVLVASTGIIGKKLQMDKIKAGIGKLLPQRNIEASKIAAEAIMTTDTFPKEIAVTTKVGKEKITVGAFAKGAGMVSPHLATMLAFITTDALITPVALRSTLRRAVAGSFNMINIDGDMSTNDMVIILANGMAKNKEITLHSKELAKFQEAITFVTSSLAKMIVKDAEGATKFVEVNVKNATSFAHAEKACLAIAKSNLVKAALYGCDPNWGRIISALGSSRINIDSKKIDIYIAGTMVAQNGVEVKFDSQVVKKKMSQEEFIILVDIKIGNKEATAWMCDLSPNYVRINSSYST